MPAAAAAAVSIEHLESNQTATVGVHRERAASIRTKTFFQFILFGSGVFVRACVCGAVIRRKSAFEQFATYAYQMPMFRGNLMIT